LPNSPPPPLRLTGIRFLTIFQEIKSLNVQFFREVTLKEQLCNFKFATCKIKNLNSELQSVLTSLIIIFHPWKLLEQNVVKPLNLESSEEKIANIGLVLLWLHSFVISNITDVNLGLQRCVTCFSCHSG
jgi:hypothetical protein